MDFIEEYFSRSQEDARCTQTTGDSMKLISDDDLTLLYYGEHDDPEFAAKVARSKELSARFDALYQNGFQHGAGGIDPRSISGRTRPDDQYLGVTRIAHLISPNPQVGGQSAVSHRI